MVSATADLHATAVARATLVRGILRYLATTPACWWSARRIGAALPLAQEEIRNVLDLFWRQGRLRRKRGVGGEYEYQIRFVERA